MKQLHPNAVKLFYWEILLALLFLGGFLLLIPVGLLLSLAVDGVADPIIATLMLIFMLCISFPALLALPWWWAKLTYENFRYQLQGDRLYIESGVIWKRSVSIPYERVQNIDVIRGPIARLLGLATLQVQTAGISGTTLVEGRIPGLLPEDANDLRDQIIAKMKHPKDQGL
jgi:membrane protein YdbS with pleckstrin-like domain